MSVDMKLIAEGVWLRTLENYLFNAHNFAKITDYRQAFQPLIEALNNRFPEPAVHVRGDSRFFVIEYHGVRIATIYRNIKPLEIDVMSEITQSIFETFDIFIQDAIKLVTLRWHFEALKNITAPLVDTIGVQRKVLHQAGSVFGVVMPEPPKHPSNSPR